MRPKSKITPKQQRAILLLLSGTRVEDVAQEIGVARGTIWKWTQQPAFAAELERQRDELYRDAFRALKALAIQAVNSLRDNLTCSKPSARNAAARYILEFAQRGIEMADLARQIAELREEVYRAQRNGAGPRPGPGTRQHTSAQR